MSYYLGKRSSKRAEGVHLRMMAIVELALSYGIIDFFVLKDGGARTKSKQEKFFDEGKSKTLKSKHLIQKDGYGHAIDLCPLPVNWHDLEAFNMMATLMFKAAAELDEQIEWGGHYKSWKDYPHFNLVGV